MADLEPDWVQVIVLRVMVSRPGTVEGPHACVC